MNKPKHDDRLSEIRVVDFAGIELPLKNTLRLDYGSVLANFDTLRKYADLPYIYILSTDQKDSINQLLGQLSSIRSTCYPHALFIIDPSGHGTTELSREELGLDIIQINTDKPEKVLHELKKYAASKFVFDRTRLKLDNSGSFPGSVDVIIIGAGITGLYAANRLIDEGISFCLIEKSDIIGGIWSKYANITSQVNSSEGAYPNWPK